MRSQCVLRWAAIIRLCNRLLCLIFSWILWKLAHVVVGIQDRPRKLGDSMRSPFGLGSWLRCAMVIPRQLALVTSLETTLVNVTLTRPFIPQENCWLDDFEPFSWRYRWFIAEEAIWIHLPLLVRHQRPWEQNGEGWSTDYELRSFMIYGLNSHSLRSLPPVSAYLSLRAAA